MPLNSDDPVGIALPLDAFDDAVGSLGRDAKLFPWFFNRLMMAAVDFSRGRPIQSGKPTRRCETGRVSGVSLPLPRREIGMAVWKCFWFLCTNVLNQRALEMNVENLAAITDGQHRFRCAKRMRENCLIGCVSIRIEGHRLGLPGCTVAAGVNIRRATRQDEGVQFF